MDVAATQRSISTETFFPRADCAPAWRVKKHNLQKALWRLIFLNKPLKQLYGDLVPPVLGGDEISIVQPEADNVCLRKDNSGTVLLGRLNSTKEYCAVNLRYQYEKEHRDDDMIEDVLDEWGVQWKVHQETRGAPKPLGFLWLDSQARSRMNHVCHLVPVFALESVFPHTPFSLSMSEALRFHYTNYELITVEQWMGVFEGVATLRQKLRQIHVYLPNLKFSDIALKYKDGKLEPAITNFREALYGSSQRPKRLFERIDVSAFSTPEMLNPLDLLPPTKPFLPMLTVRSKIRDEDLTGELGQRMKDLIYSFGEKAWSDRKGLEHVVDHLSRVVLELVNRSQNTGSNSASVETLSSPSHGSKATVKTDTPPSPPFESRISNERDSKQSADDKSCMSIPSPIASGAANTAEVTGRIRVARGRGRAFVTHSQESPRPGLLNHQTCKDTVQDYMRVSKEAIRNYMPPPPPLSEVDKSDYLPPPPPVN